MVMRWKLVSNVMNDEYHKYIYKQLSCLQDIVEQLKCCQQGMLTPNVTSMLWLPWAIDTLLDIYHFNNIND